MSEDLYVVCNILTDDEGTDSSGYSYADYFEVKWDGKQTSIKPGETAILPEYLANHFAKHLIDYLLTRDKKLIHDEELRGRLLSKIILHKASKEDRPASKEETDRTQSDQLLTTGIEDRYVQLAQKEQELAKEADKTKLMRQEVEKQSSRLTDLISSYEKREKLVKDKEKELRVREIKLSDTEIVA